MQIRSQGVSSFLKAPGEAEGALIYGPDHGLVGERSKLLEAAILGTGTGDPFRRIELSEAALKDAPGALYAEAASLSMLGGRKFIRVRTSADVATAALKAYLDEREAGAPRPDAFVVFEAGDLRKTSALRKAAEDSPLIAVMACYEDTEESLDALVESAARQAGARILPDAKQALLERLGSDRGVSRQEIDKLLTYAGAGLPGVQPLISHADVLAIVGDSSAAELDNLIEAVFSGDVRDTARLFARVSAAGTNPVGILRMAAGHLDRIAAAPPGGFGAANNPYQRALQRQAERWPAPNIERAQCMTLQAELDCKTTGMPAGAICERTLLALARVAARGSG